MKLAFIVSVVTCTAASAHAQLPGFRAPAADTVVAPNSPRAAVENFLRLARANDWRGASTYLMIPAAERPRAEALAKRLKAVLDQRLALDLRNISPLASGDTADGEPDSDQLGLIVGPEGEGAVRLVRAFNLTPPRWVFSMATVSRVDAWYTNLGAPWLRDHLPASLMREGPFHVFLWQWIALALAIPVLLAFSWLMSELLRTLLLRIASRTTTEWDNRLIEGLRAPFRLWISALGITPLMELLQINAAAAAGLRAVSRGLVLIAMFWGLLRVIRLVQKHLEQAAFQHGQVQARTLVPLLGNFLRVTLAIVALLVALAQFGYPVGSLLTTLGIGGIAFALAAQKTVEHLFGSVSLAADKAFRVGDWVRAGPTEGAVERIGLRSTSFRTNDRTVVRVPNGRLADERIETFGERDRMLLRVDLDLLYDTRPEQFDAIRADIEKLLRAHPKIWPEAVRVFVVEFRESAIRMNITSWFQTTNYDEFLAIRHALLLEIMRIVERNGSGFAFPTRTLVHVRPEEQEPQ